MILRLVAAVLVTTLLTTDAFAPSGAVHSQHKRDPDLLEYAISVARTYENDPSYLLGEIAVRYASLGQFNSALELANSIDDEAERDVAKAKIATILRKSGNTERASEILDSIQLFMESQGTQVPRHKTYILGQIAQELAACGAFERVFELALVNDDPYLIRTSLDAVLDNFVPNENERNDFSVLSKVIRLSARLNNGEDGVVIRTVAEKYAEAGQYGKAVRLADSLAEEGEDADDFDRDQATANIACLLAKRGQFTRAINLAESTDDYFKFEALIQIAREQTATARNEEAVRLLERVTLPLLQEPYEQIDFDDAGTGSNRLAGVAIAYDGAGFKDKAEKLMAIALKRARRVRKFTERDQALLEVAVAYAELGMFEQAADAAQATNFTYFKIKPLADVAIVMLRQKRNSEVRQLVEMIREASVEQRPESKADGLVEIAGAYLAMGDNKSAVDILSAAVEIARNSPVNDFQPAVMQKIAVALAQAGDYTKAIEVIAEIKSTFHRAFTLADIGVLQARAGWTPDEHAGTILTAMVK